ncbi:Xaa-Pro peptidase family protein [Candidatus Persebacteraceae bacterium Df01]|uniref:Xaa-Pro peptidase family protein n=1 Tax=Candidatus Doriopsillibacter californiensis TaxID=2970740 RepID=A0ABT7QKU5_9GAMM|nr:Xaa-Pro peptidase family protein [Candidatus Persebacteraceae bacterium Df01]
MFKRGFTEQEYRRRCAAAQEFMTTTDVDVLLLTTEAELFYFSGFYTPFWRSPTRPWFLLLPRTGKPIAVIPSIGEALMKNCHVESIFTWVAPHADDEGISLLAKQLQQQNALRIGMMSGRQSHLRMPQQDFQQLQQKIPDSIFIDVTVAIHAVRQCKSVAEIEKIEHVCDVVSTVFEQVPEWLQIGMTAREAHRRFKIECLLAGVDDVNYLACGNGAGGYVDIISPPDDTLLKDGDIFMLDAGCVIDGYYCDFNRNYALGRISTKSRQAYDTLWRATEAVLAAAKPSTRCCDLFFAMNDVIRVAGYDTASAGRYGHGVGIELTETPSLVEWDKTPLRPGMVIAIEPSLIYADGMTMVHEENIVITDTTARLLTHRASKKMPLISSIESI